MDPKTGLPLAFLLATAASLSIANATAVSGSSEELLKPGSLRELLPPMNIPAAAGVERARVSQACSYGFWRRC
jgi:hypothetical protein